ncbi:hypothetical protein SOASR032_13300 [Pragia fontium]|uniref:Uncharacterized protein n=1 Tax=Pragia fontium TaxID=82985 RepID=A0ABQ5LGN4_9GAMM|nr:hypothetical protein SOASR032_13300 [Pragia fontium]
MAEWIHIGFYIQYWDYINIGRNLTKNRSRIGSGEDIHRVKRNTLVALDIVKKRLFMVSNAVYVRFILFYIRYRLIY